MYYYPDIWVIFGDKFDDGTLEISFYQDFCPGWDCPTIYRYFYLQPLDKKKLTLKAPLWPLNTNRDINGWYVCDTCSYLKSLYGYEWGIEWDNPETIRFHAIAKDTFLLEIKDQNDNNQYKYLKLYLTTIMSISIRKSIPF